MNGMPMPGTRMPWMPMPGIHGPPRPTVDLSLALAIVALGIATA
jgi:hypothetical protein